MIKKAPLQFSLLLLLTFFAISTSYAIEPNKLTCQYAAEQVIINDMSPHFGWQLTSKQKGDKQTAFQLLVASEPEILKEGLSDYWDSNKILTSQSQHIAYAGKPLQYKSRYYWKMRVWNAQNELSSWSETKYFDTALSPNDWTALWIGAISHQDAKLPSGRNFHTPGLKPQLAQLWDSVVPLAKRSILLRKDFTAASGIKHARVYVCGLGHYELSLNGKKVGDSEFSPLWSEYDKTVYYNMYDITHELNMGANTFGVILGNGMYNVAGGRYTKFRVSFGPPTLLLQTFIEYKDGTKEMIVSDRSWKYTPSAISFNCILGGEDYDANLEQVGWDNIGFTDNSWSSVVLQDAPRGKLLAQTAPPIKISETYSVKTVAEPLQGIQVFDMGQNIAGFPSLKVQGKKGQKVRMLVGEVLKDGLVDQSKSGGPHYYEYTLKGGLVEEWKPRFAYYGFQYIQIEGVDWKKDSSKGSKPLLVDLNAHFVHSSAPATGSFESSNEIFNRTHFLIDKSTRSNMQSVLTDCPHREKLGWLEETHLNAPGLFFNYDLSRYFPKIQRDMQDAQTADGLVPDIAPEYVIFDGGFRDSPEWGSAAVINPWNYYTWYGDQSLLHTSYPTMKRYADYLTSKAKDNILSHGLGDWYDYGPHSAGVSRNTPIEITATGHYYYVVKILSQTAKILHYDSDAADYSLLAENIRCSFNKHLFNQETQQYGSGSQCSNALPLFLDIVEPQNRKAVLDNLLADIKAKGMRLSTGDVGNRYLYQALATNDQNETMFKLHNHYEVPGYGFQIKMGVTTLTEQWDPRNGDSWNHFMMGQIEEWFFKTLLGINPDETKPGFQHFIIKPQPVGDLSFVKGHYDSLYGRIESDWKIEKKEFVLRVNIPINSSASIVLPSNKIESLLIDGQRNSPLVDIVGLVENKIHLELSSGEYIFKVKR